MALTAGKADRLDREFLPRLAVGLVRVGCSLVLGAAKPWLSVFEGPIQRCSHREVDDWWYYVLTQDLNASTLLWFDHCCFIRYSRWTVQHQTFLSRRTVAVSPPWLLINSFRQHRLKAGAVTHVTVHSRSTVQWKSGQENINLSNSI